MVPWGVRNCRTALEFGMQCRECSKQYIGDQSGFLSTKEVLYFECWLHQQKWTI